MTDKEIRRVLADLAFAAEDCGDDDLAMLLAQVHSAVLHDQVPSLCAQLTTPPAPEYHREHVVTRPQPPRYARLRERVLQ